MSRREKRDSQRKSPALHAQQRCAQRQTARGERKCRGLALDGRGEKRTRNGSPRHFTHKNGVIRGKRLAGKESAGDLLWTEEGKKGTRNGSPRHFTHKNGVIRGKRLAGKESAGDLLWTEEGAGAPVCAPEFSMRLTQPLVVRVVPVAAHGGGIVVVVVPRTAPQDESGPPDPRWMGAE